MAIKGVTTKYNAKTASDKDGFFEFTELNADTYIIKAKKKRYRLPKTTVELDDLETKEIEIEMSKVSKIKALPLEKIK